MCSFLTPLLAIALSQPLGPLTCLHGPGESDWQRQRVDDAIDFIRDVQAAEARAYRERGTYVPLREAVGVTQVPTGFLPRLTADRWSYTIIVKDGFDPCAFALVSDEHGVIYEATPTQRVADADDVPESSWNVDDEG